MEEHQETAEASTEDKTERQLSKPPPRDMRLLEFFTGNDLEPQSLHGSFEAMSATSFARGVPDPDGRIINSNAVGFRQRSEMELLDRAETSRDNEDDCLKSDRVSRAQKHRDTRAIIARLDPSHVKILKLAFGSQDQVPCMQARKLDGKSGTIAQRREHEDSTRHFEAVGRLGPWRQVLPETNAAREAFAVWQEESRSARAQNGASTRRAVDTGIARWLIDVCARSGREKRYEKVLNAAQLEAFRMVRESWNLWADARGRRRRDVDTPTPGSMLPEGW